MKIHHFGSTDITVSMLCFATSNFARHLDQGHAFTMLDTFRGAGGNFFETTGNAVAAGAGRGFNALSEEFFARWFHARAIPRRELVLAVRIAPRRAMREDDPSFAATVQTLVHTSLSRIGTDYVDLLVVDWHESLLPLRRSLPAIEAVVVSGTARRVVLASWPPEHLKLAQKLLPGSLAGLQRDYSLLNQSPGEDAALALCREGGLGFIARAPLAGAHPVVGRALSHASWRTRGDPLIAADADAQWPTLSAVARRHGCSTARIALAWVLAQRGVTSVRVSTRTTLELNDLLAAPEVRLSKDELTILARRHGPAITRPAAKIAPEIVHVGSPDAGAYHPVALTRFGAPGLLVA